MATADPPPDESLTEPDGRPTLTEHHSPRGDRLASDDSSAPGPERRFSARPHDVDVEHDASNRSEGRQGNHITPMGGGGLIDFDDVSAVVYGFWSGCRGLSLICRLYHIHDIQSWH